ncbi:MAG: cyclic nucleotide-binding domain-containing protein [Pseudomonadales bacterium]|nr:cyclic nucleotide-binding domain-containing protein [Pseudomonadales bacterium]
MAKYSPLSQLSPKYLNQVMKHSKVMTFESGEVIFEKIHELPFVYYLLRGKLNARKSIISSSTIDAQTPECLFSINDKIPTGVSVKAQSDGHILMVDPKFLDRALAWSEADEKQPAPGQEARVKPRGDKSASAKKSSTPARAATQVNHESELPAGEFDEEYFDWMTNLLEFPLFFNLPPVHIQTLFERFEQVCVAKDDVIIKEGDEGDYFYLLVEGRARVEIDEQPGKEIILSQGAYFGEEALVSETVRSATIIMEEDGVLARLDKDSFQSLLHDPIVKYISEKEFKEKLLDHPGKVEKLDIRSLAEFEYTPLPECLHIPLNELRDKIPTLDKSVTYCISEEGGQRGDIAAHILAQNSIDVFVIRS